MPLTNEINNIKKRIKDSKESICFPVIETGKDSYYLDYKDSIHSEDVITEYSSDFLDFKRELSLLWSESSNTVFSQDILSSVLKIKDDEKSVVEAVQLYNYMM